MEMNVFNVEEEPVFLIDSQGVQCHLVVPLRVNRHALSVLEVNHVQFGSVMIRQSTVPKPSGAQLL